MSAPIPNHSENDRPNKPEPTAVDLARHASGAAKRFVAGAENRTLVVGLTAILALLTIVVIAASVSRPSLDEKVTTAYGYDRFAKLHGCEYDKGMLDTLGYSLGECDGGYPFGIDDDGNITID